MSSILAPNETTFGKSGIPVRPTWPIMDSSKTQSLMDCPRDFFYSHILGWRPKHTSIHLAFGSAWHKAMEIILTKGIHPYVIEEAYQVFCDHYQREMDMSLTVLEDLHPSKNPSNAFLALAEYAGRWKDDPSRTLHVEVAGTVPIREDRILHTKTDAIRRYPEDHRRSNQIYSLEHKTTTRQTKPWEEKWFYLFQVGTYYHFLKCLFEPDEVYGIVINGAIFRKGGNAFPRIPVTYSLEMWEAWLSDANHWWDYLEWNMEILYDSSPSDRVMVAFPRNSASCSKFGCRHPELCAVQANPLQRCDNLPLDYKIDFWDPRRNEEKASKVIHIEKEEKLAPDS